MNFFKRARRLSQDELKTLASLCAGAALLVAVALVLSGNSFVPQLHKLALERFGAQAAAIVVSSNGGTQCTSSSPCQFTVPAQVTSLSVQLWGAGGSGGGSTWYTGGSCHGYGIYSTPSSGGWGAGGYTTATVPVSPGEVLDIVVGFDTGGSYINAAGGYGGGYSGIFSGAPSQATALVMAGGGGSNGWWDVQAGGGYNCGVQIGGGWSGGTGGGGGGSSGADASGASGTGGTQTNGSGPLTGTAGGGSGYFGGTGQVNEGGAHFSGGGGGSGYCNPSLSSCTTVTATSTQAADYWQLAANGAGNVGQNGLVVVLNLTPTPPTLSITGNGTNPTTVVVGKPVTVAATFTPSLGDTLQATAINDNAGNDWCGTGNSCNDNTIWYASPLSSKSFTFTPNTTGSFLFTPAATTIAYSSWNNYGQSLTVTVNPVPPTCTDIPGNPTMAPPGCNPPPQGGGACIPSGDVYTSGQCVPGQCPGAHEVDYPTCSCDFGYKMQSGSCVLITCQDPHAIPPLCSSCLSGYEMQNGTCALIPPTLSISASPTRVVSRNTAALTWEVENLAADVSTQCLITSSPVGIFSQTMPVNTAPTWSGSEVATGPITGTTVFTLSCTGAAPASATVGLIPQYEEQ